MTDFDPRRLGAITASRIHDLIAVVGTPGDYVLEQREPGVYAITRPGASRATKVLKGVDEKEAAAICEEMNTPTFAASHDQYLYELAADLLSVDGEPHSYREDRERGHRREIDALLQWSVRHWQMLGESEYVPHPQFERAGCTPDAFIGAEGLVQAKAPRAWRQLRRIHTGKVEQEIWEQCQWELECTGRDYDVVVSYCPDLVSPYDYWELVILPDPEAQEWMRRVYHESARQLECILVELQRVVE